MSDLALTIRPESPEDAGPVLRLHERAFGPGRFARTAFRLRERDEALARLSFSALVGTLLVGSVRMSAIRIGSGHGLVLGPLTVEPAFEGRGIGAALTARALDAARADGHELVLLVGDPPYYARVGFAQAPVGRFVLPAPVDPTRLLVFELVPGATERYGGNVMPDRG